jgi:subtilisin family serine protease
MTFRYISLLALGLGLGWCHAQTPVGELDEPFEFREPQATLYRVVKPAAGKQSALGGPSWLRAWPANGSSNSLEVGSRVVLRVTAPGLLTNLLAGAAARADRQITSNLFILQAPDAWTAAREAQRLAGLPGVEVSHPVRRRPVKLHSQFAPLPNDPYYGRQWHLENRNTNTGAALGPDLNVRRAWAYTRGEGVILALSDDGVETGHPDLAANASPTNHFNFVTGFANGNPATDAQIHGTAVAGLAAAVGGNRRGVAGVAPAARFASWVVFDSTDNLATEERVMDMFQFRSNIVSVQNHSWGNATVGLLPLGTLESAGIAHAVENGRGGRGVVIVRSGGNNRADGNDGNEDGYSQDPRQIAVAAVRNNGRVAAFSTPGANLLVAAPSGERNAELVQGGTTNYPGLLTTDRQGARGYSATTLDGDTADYTFGAASFSGTSAAAPQVSGVAALMLAANPTLGYRDVQQLLILASTQTDPADPDLALNGAGLAVSHNSGFGVPDAGRAVAMARAWRPRPAPVSVAVTNATGGAIPDDGLKVMITGDQVSASLALIPAYPSQGVHPVTPTTALALVDVGQALKPITQDLRGKAALIQRGTSLFVQKIAFAAAAGAGLAVIYNNVDGSERIYMAGADIHLAPIPAVFISQTAGEALRAYMLTNAETRAQIVLQAARFALPVTTSLLCEHVALRVQAGHPRRADVLITLTSPAGTRSILHHPNQDSGTRLDDWTYYSTHHFFESSVGVWQVEVGDEQAGQAGQVASVELSIKGTPIADSDGDGLDDDWEQAHFGSLALGPRDDPDGDGQNNLREFILGTDPLVVDMAFRLDLSPWNNKLARLSWPATTNFHYQVLVGTDPSAAPTLAADLPGRWPEAEWFTAYTNLHHQFFRVQAIPSGQ